MRPASMELAARLAARVTTLCTCWLLRRRDGRRFGATDHDRALEVDGVECLPAVGLGDAELTASDGLAPDRAFLTGALEAEFLDEGDLRAGLWDGAEVDVWRVYWNAPDHRLRIWSGRLSEVSAEGGAFRAELVSAKADLERTIGRVYARTCDAELGDARCGVDLTNEAFVGEGTVAANPSANVIRADGLATFDDGWFSGGVLTWLSGARTDLQARVRVHRGAELELVGPIGEVGDLFRVTAGCDKSFAMCGARFANRDNFRGFPHMPGPDAVLAGPSSSTGEKR